MVLDGPSGRHVTMTYPIWRTRVADLDGDGMDEILMGKTKTNRGVRAVTVWQWANDELDPVYLTTRLPHEPDDFKVERCGDRDCLVTIENGEETWLTEYEWTGFGFLLTGRRRDSK